jgi:hypothetical protein
VGGFHSGRHTVVGKVEAAIHPDALLRDFGVVLRAHWPGALGGHPLSLAGWLGRCAQQHGGCDTYSGALSALHGGGGGGGNGSSSSNRRCCSRVLAAVAMTWVVLW